MAKDISRQKEYELEYWVDSSIFSADSLKNYVQEKLRNDYQNIRLEIQKRENHLALNIKATKKLIEKCYKLDFNGSKCFRAKDELGRKSSMKAYPILAEIELGLREFINEAIVKIYGFNWFSSYKKRTKSSILEEVDNSEKERSRQNRKLHEIEFTSFRELIGFVTHRVKEWSPDHYITVDDLNNLLSSCSSMPEIRKEVERRTKEVSYWDDIFSHYFDDKRSWESLKKEILFVIECRNFVMHHRSIFPSQVKRLKKIRNKIQQILESAKSEIPQEELEEVKLSSKTLERSSFDFATMIDYVNSILPDIEAQILAEEKKHSEIFRKTAEKANGLAQTSRENSLELGKHLPEEE